LQIGYFAATRLGFILRIQNEFAPNKKEPMCQDEHGLTEELFIGTVKNAIQYNKENSKTLECD